MHISWSLHIGIFKALSVSAHCHMLLSFLHPAVIGHAAALVCGSARTPYRDRCLWNTWSSLKLYRCSYFLKWSLENWMTVEQHCWQSVCSRVSWNWKTIIIRWHIFLPFSDLCLPPTNNCPGVLHGNRANWLATTCFLI